MNIRQSIYVRHYGQTVNLINKWDVKRILNSGGHQNEANAYNNHGFSCSFHPGYRARQRIAAKTTGKPYLPHRVNELASLKVLFGVDLALRIDAKRKTLEHPSLPCPGVGARHP